MRLLCTFAAIIALSLAESEQNIYDDLVAMETMELKKTRDLKPEASVYSSYVPSNNNWNVPNNNWNIPNKDNNYNVPNNNWNIPNKDNNWNVPNNNWNQPPYVPPTWNPPQNPVNYYPPVTPGPFPSGGGPVTFPPYNPATPSPVQSDYIPPQNNYYPPQQSWSTPNYHPTTTTTPVSVIKNEQYYGDNGSYKYEYKIGDGTHVGEEGYSTDPKDEESLVKKGWYSYQGADGRTYTVTYWADKTGFHAYGDHLPTPPTPHPAIQAAIDKENAENNKPQTGYNPQPQPQPQPQPHPQPPTQPQILPQPPNPSYDQTYYPPQQTNYPSQQTYYPPQQSGYGK